MPDFLPVYLYFGVVFAITLFILGLSGAIPSKKNNPVKFLPYESGIKTQTHLMQKRFPIQHYLIALIFLVFDVEIVFLYPWAVVSKKVGPFAFYEMVFFLVTLLIGFAYIWRKKGLEWE